MLAYYEDKKEQKLKAKMLSLPKRFEEKGVERTIIFLRRLHRLYKDNADKLVIINNFGMSVLDEAKKVSPCAGVCLKMELMEIRRAIRATGDENAWRVTVKAPIDPKRSKTGSPLPSPSNG